MKRKYIALAACTLLFATCKKLDDCNHPPANDEVCKLAGVTETFKENGKPTNRSLFSAVFSQETGKASRIVFYRYFNNPADYLTLDLKYEGNNVYFFDAQNSADTVQTAVFDNLGRLKEIRSGNAAVQNLHPVTFDYQAAKLVNITVDDGYIYGHSIVPTYDAYGNVISLEDPAHDFWTFFYTYDLTKKATQQVYPDDLHILSEYNIELALYLGWLPDLQPKYKRISTRVSPTTSVSDTVYYANLLNHVYDTGNKLTSYMATSYMVQDHTYNSAWYCGGTN